MISIEQFFCSPKILVFNITVSFSFNVLKVIAISAEVNLSPFLKHKKGNNKLIYLFIF